MTASIVSSRTQGEMVLALRDSTRADPSSWWMDTAPREFRSDKLNSVDEQAAAVLTGRPKGRNRGSPGAAPALEIQAAVLRTVTP